MQGYWAINRLYAGGTWDLEEPAFPDDVLKANALWDELHGLSKQNPRAIYKAVLVKCSELPPEMLPMVTHMAMDGNVYIRDAR